MVVVDGWVVRAVRVGGGADNRVRFGWRRCECCVAGGVCTCCWWCSRWVWVAVAVVLRVCLLLRWCVSGCCGLCLCGCGVVVIYC